MNNEEHVDERMIRFLQSAIRVAVRVLAVLMTFVILVGTIDVGWTLCAYLMANPKFVLTIKDILATFGAFIAVLIAIEIFVNIVLYLRDDVIHVKIVMATPLMAVSRKVIILDVDSSSTGFLLGLAAVVLAMSIGYWIVHALGDKAQRVVSEEKYP